MQGVRQCARFVRPRSYGFADTNIGDCHAKPFHRMSSALSFYLGGAVVSALWGYVWLCERWPRYFRRSFGILAAACGWPVICAVVLYVKLRGEERTAGL